MKTEGLESLLFTPARPVAYKIERDIEPAISPLFGGRTMNRELIKSVMQDDGDATLTERLSALRSAPERMKEITQQYGVPEWLSLWIEKMNEPGETHDAASLKEIHRRALAGLPLGSDTDKAMRELSALRIESLLSPNAIVNDKLSGRGAGKYREIAEGLIEALRDGDDGTFMKFRRQVSSRTLK